MLLNLIFSIIASLLREVIIFPKRAFNLLKEIYCSKGNKGGLWREIHYPRRGHNWAFYFLLSLLMLYLFYLTITFVDSFSFTQWAYWLWMPVTVIAWAFIVYRGLGIYKKNVERVNKDIIDCLSYMIESLKLFDEEYLEKVDKDGKIVKVKHIARVVRIFYKETEKHILVRVMREGDRFTDISTSLGENLESALGLELESQNKTINFVEYKFLKFPESRIDLATTVSKLNTSDEIQITGNISNEV